METGTAAPTPIAGRRVPVSGTAALAFNVKREEVNGLRPMPTPFEVYAWLQVWYSGRQVRNCQW
jgi:hypothetical protein